MGRWGWSAELETKNKLAEVSKREKAAENHQVSWPFQRPRKWRSGGDYVSISLSKIEPVKKAGGL